MSQDVLQALLEAIDTEMSTALLADLRDPAKRTPQLYNAIQKHLDRHKFAIQKLQANAPVLGELADGLEEFRKHSSAFDDAEEGSVH